VALSRWLSSLRLRLRAGAKVDVAAGELEIDVLKGRAARGHLGEGNARLAVKTTIRRLRAKLGDPPVIRTVREGGYRIGDR